MSTIDIDKWLEDLYAQAHLDRKAGRIVYDTIDDLLWNGHLEIVDEILRRVDIEKFTIFGSLSFLTITNTARDHLTQYPSYYDRLEERYKREIPERCERILKGLAPNRSL